MRKIVPGEADKSFGVQVARLAGLPKSVVKRALEVMEELESTSLVHHLPVIIDETIKKRNIPAEVNENFESSCANSVNEVLQFSMFPEETQFIDELRKLDLNDMTPMQALNYL